MSSAATTKDVTHAELAYGDGEVMLGFASPEYRSPRRHAQGCEQAAKWLDNPYVVDGVLVQVDDLDAHLEHARSAGAEILRGPDDQPFGRLYTGRRRRGTPLDVRPATGLIDSRKERRISFARLLNGHLRSTTFTRAPSTARD